MVDSYLKILFIDDSPEDVEIAVLQLERDGLTISWSRVETAAELHQFLSSNHVDIIVSDFSMPMFSGAKAFQISNELAPQIPFIFFSGTIGEERAIELIRNGATDYVLKDNIKRFPFAVRRALTDAAEKRRSHQVEQDKSKLAAIVEATNDHVAIIDLKYQFVYMNAAGRALTGIDDQDISEINFFSFYKDEIQKRMQNEVWPELMRIGIWRGETVLVTRSHEEIPIFQSIIIHRDEAGNILHFSTIIRDLRDRQAYEDRIRYLANYNELTGLPNRSLLSERFKQASIRCSVDGQSIALLMIDIDRFKMINDGYGHAVGDLVLKMIGNRLQSLVQIHDTVAHLSADTFAIMFNNVNLKEDVFQITHDTLANLSKPYELSNGLSIHISACIGVSLYPSDGYDFETLHRNADIAMNRAKEQSLNNHQFYCSEMTQAAAERVDLEHDLRIAVKNNQLELHYQPKFDLETRNITGVEALVRWNHPNRGWIPPDIFIQISEDSELILEIGGWVLVAACRQLRQWDERGMHVPRIAVNVSAKQFIRDDFIAIVRSAIDDAGIDPQRLELELTESVLLEEQESAIVTLNQLKELGLNVSVDDFGTGYSSLSYLSQLPVDCVKIDRSFVHECMIEKRCTVIVQAIVSLAKALGLRVVAEGIETTEQLMFLRSLKCHEGQGYWYSKPLALGEIEKFITTKNGSLAQRKNS